MGADVVLRIAALSPWGKSGGRESQQLMLWSVRSERGHSNGAYRGILLDIRRAEPYFRIEQSLDSGWRGFFAIALQSIGVATHNPGDAREFVQRQLGKQAELIGTFFSLGSNTALEMRFSKRASARKCGNPVLDVTLRGRVSAATEQEALTGISELFGNVWPSLVSVSDDYHWDSVESADEYFATFGQDYEHHIAIARREVVLHLDVIEGLARPIGFIGQPPDRNEPSDPSVCFIAPFRNSGSTFEYLFRVLLMQPAACALSVAIQPTRIGGDELAFLSSQIQQCERYQQLPNEGRVSHPHRFSPPFRSHATTISRVLERSLFTLTDDAFAVRIQLASAAKIGTGLVDAVGGAITHTPAAPQLGIAEGPGDHSLSGGYDWYEPADLDQQVAASTNFKEIDFIPWCPTVLADKAKRLRYLMGAHESAAAFRLPVPILGRFPGVETMLSRYIVADLDLPEEGLLLGYNERLGTKSEVRLTPEDRRRHCYMVGQTGTGKTTVLHNLIMQDIRAGRGVCLLDPHGDLVARVLAELPPERKGDVVHYDPADPDSPIALNLFDCSDEADRDRAINHLLEMFAAFYNMHEAGGPMFELYFRQTAKLLTDDLGAPGTLLDYQRIFADRSFRASKIAACKDNEVRDFWRIAEKRSGENDLDNISFYITAKLTRFVNDVFVRKLIERPKSNIDLLDAMGQRKIVLLNLQKGVLGNLNCSMLGALWISLLERATFRRLQKRSGDYPEFNLYVDEFQQFAFDSFVALLAEGRKFGLNIIIANQYLDQMPDRVISAVVGDVGTMIVLRIGPRDAEKLRDLFAPTIQMHDFLLLPNHRAYVKTLIHGQAVLPFSLETIGSARFISGGSQNLS